MASIARKSAISLLDGPLCSSARVACSEWPSRAQSVHFGLRSRPGLEVSGEARSREGLGGR
eukprot:6334340-Pyramimonas_sp.AAC.1